MRITGTFIDEISVNINSNNWGPKQWAEDFRIMKAVGIDTVILIRAGLGQFACFNSAVLKKEVGLFPVDLDLVDLFLRLSEENGMDFFFGLYDSNRYINVENNPQKEIVINKLFIDEVLGKYGQRKAFKGWYLSHELGRWHEATVQCLSELGAYCKKVTPKLPTLISPYFCGPKLGTPYNKNVISLEDHCEEWERILSAIEGAVDIAAFQIGQLGYREMSGFLTATNKLIKKHGMKPWSNVETFCHELPMRGLPIDYRKLLLKSEIAEKAGAEKFITFEFSKFMSPQSVWPAAKNLFERYCEHYNIKI